MATTVIALVDGTELGRATVRVTTLGEEFVRDVAGACVAADFPSAAESVRLVWQEAGQNFVLAEGRAPVGVNHAGTSEGGFLENPSPNSFQSGIGVISGWVCEAEGVRSRLAISGGRWRATARSGWTPKTCAGRGQRLWVALQLELLGDGEHEVIARVDGTELGRTTVRVTTLGEEFVQGAEGECTVSDFPVPGERVTLTWQQNSQNFVMTDVQ